MAGKDSGVKLCVNCKWHKFYLWREGGEDHRCSCPENQKSDPVTGKVKPAVSNNCHSLRLTFGNNGFAQCGPSGAWFEPKP